MKIIVLFFSSLLFASVVAAQNIQGGIVAGISTSQVSGDDLSGFHKAGLLLGASASVRLKAKTGLQMEIEYIEKGSRKIANVDKNDFWQYSLNLNYIEIPLIFRYFYKESLILGTGLAYASLLSWKEHSEDVSGVLATNSRAMHPYDVSFLLEAAYPLGGKVMFGWRFSNSVIPIRKHQSGATYQLNLGQYNTVMSFALSYIFKKTN